MTREQQILSLKGLVVATAVMMQRQHGGIVEELVSDGWLGAILAVDHYDPEHEAGASLASYAKHRIRGAMLDGLRERDWLTVKQRRDINAGLHVAPEPPLSIDLAGDGLRVAETLTDPVSSGAIDLRLEEMDIFSALDLLPERERWVITQNVFAGRTLQALADDLGLSPGRLWQLARRAKLLLSKGFTAAA